MQFVADIRKNIAETIYQIDRVTVIAQVTLFMFVVFGPSFWFTVPIYQGALLLSLVFPKVVKTSYLWIVITTVTALALFSEWHSVDNHKWLMLYWGLAFVVATVVSRGDTDALHVFLKKNAWFMLIFIMGLSVVQKILGGAYLSGAFFEFTLLTDQRFFIITHYLGGLPAKDFFLNAEMFLQYPRAEFTLFLTQRVTLIAFVMTYALLLIEILIPVFLLIQKKSYQNFAHLLNGLFIAVVYLIAPVYAFGFLLAVLGIACLSSDSRKLFLMYILLMLVIFLYKVPWFSLYYYFTIGV
ncbi:MAG TPA: hypothetical protein VJH21_02990 [Candidatus Paceibacterota bacterium]